MTPVRRRNKRKEPAAFLFAKGRVYPKRRERGEGAEENRRGRGRGQIGHSKSSKFGLSFTENLQ